MPLTALHRVRWAVRATLTLGVAASVSANILHAQPNPISQAIAAWPPLALLLTVELISRVPVHRRSLAFARLTATATIAGIAAWVSYWHMAAVAARYGETGASAYLLPLSVDGLIVVASICLVELGGRISAAALAAAPAPAAPAPAPVAEAAPVPTVHAGAGLVAPGAAKARSTARRATGAGTAGRRSTGASSSRPANSRSADRRPATKAAPRPRRPVSETAALAAEIEARQPHAKEADVAEALGITTARLRAVRREAQARELAHAA